MQTIDNILHTFEGYRMEPTPLDEYETKGKALLAERIAPYVAAGDPIDFVMLGFPFKSTNTRDKVIGRMPDLGEEATIKNFAQFDADIKQAYAPGANITIVSDGYIFNDLLGVDDREVMEYKERSVDMGRQAPMTWYDLGDFYSGRSIATKREKVVAQFGITPEKLEQQILLNPDVNFLYRGMIHFMEEELAMQTFVSRSQMQKAAKKLTREMMYRNEAYNNLVRAEFPNHVRLSMHPSVNNGYKYSFKLIPGKNTRYSAWHSAVLVDGRTNEYTTVHKKDALAAGCELVYVDGRPYYFTNSNL